MEMKNSSKEWILYKLIFQKLMCALGPVDMDMFASRLCHQILKYINWQPDPHVWMVDAFQINWTHLKAYAFPPFARGSVSQVNERQVYTDYNNISVAFPTMVNPVT